MTYSPSPLQLENLKWQAKRLRSQLARNGTDISHSKSLELIAQQHGFKDWNTLHGSLGNQMPPSPLQIGERVEGSYLGQDFEGEVVGVQARQHDDLFTITLAFDDPVDVVTFESFSNMRKKVSALIDRDGRSPAKTSNGKPQMLVFRQAMSR